MKQLGVSRGDVILIKGGRETVAIADRNYPADTGQGIIRIDGILRKNSKSGIGDLVCISPCEIKEAKKMKFDYVTKKDIVKNVSQQGIILNNPNAQIGQALYHLQRKTKFRRPQIKKFISKEGKTLGWTLVDDTFIWKEERFE